MSWTFYIRLDMRDGSWLEGNETSWVVDNDGDGHEVIMYSQTLGREQDTLPLAQTRRAVLKGIGYATEDEAIEAGMLWRARFMAAFTSLLIGVDFGDRSVRQTSWSRHAIAAVSQATGRSAVVYQGGMLVYESKSAPIFMPTVTATGTVTGPLRIPAALAKVGRTEGLSKERQVTYDLFSAALGLGSGDACYAMLMAALETMVKPQSRPAESVVHVSRLMELTRNSELPEREIASIIGALKWLRQESIGQAGMRIAKVLEPNTYMDEAPAVFFRKCYDIRSRLLHGTDPLPTAQDVSARIPHLKRFVSDLICKI